MTRIARLARNAVIEIAASRRTFSLIGWLAGRFHCRPTELLEIIDEITYILGMNHGNSHAENMNLWEK